jgi:ubiquinone/menaquinone biosynthesis C-methylase UbiE
MTQSKNQKTYAANSIVQHYKNLNQLQPAEQMLLERLQSIANPIKMLDIGVGAGRTTKHFQPKVAQYIGIDNSPEMIAACRSRFPQLPPDTFDTCDARDLSRYPDNSFDLLLFSFNGIDYVSHDDRHLIFQELHRIGKPDALLFFSSHNLQGFDRLIDLKSQLSFNPLTTYSNLVILSLLRFLNRPYNPNQLKQLPHAILKDESHNFRLDTYYIRPSAQVIQLKPHFDNIQVYSWRNTTELITERDRASNTDMWLYYQCTIKKPSGESQNPPPTSP